MTKNIQADDPIYFVPPHSVEDVITPQAELIDWGIKIIGVPEFWRQTKGEGIKVAVLDTGIAHQHPDLRDAIAEMEDFSGSRTGPSDQNGHGTHCAGTIAARQNSSGVVGAAPLAKLYIGKVLGDNGSGSDRSVAGGIDWAVEQKVHVISMSLGSPQRSPLIHAAVQRAANAGIFIIAAAGNEGPRLDTMGYPGKYAETISVGAIDRRLKVTGFSSRSGRSDNILDIMAPGDQILSTYPPNGLKKLSGTSMATPLISGVVALMLSKHEKHGGGTDLKTVGDLREHLRRTAIDMGPRGWDASYGAGIIDPKKLLVVKDPTPPPPPPPPPPPAGKVLTFEAAKDFSPAGLAKLQRFAGNTQLVEVTDPNGEKITITL